MVEAYTIEFVVLLYLMCVYWDINCEEAFLKLKNSLCNSRILSYPIPDLLFVVDSDVSNFGIGKVLSQIQEGQEKVNAYFSKVLPKPEKITVTQKELLTVIKSLEYFHKYL